MNTPPSEKHLGFLINDVARLVRRAFDQRAQSCSLTRAQWQVLAYLFHNEGSNQASVAEALDVEPITLSRHIDRLEALGYVARVPDPADRRARRLHLTESVRPLLDEMKTIGNEVIDTALEGITADEAETLICLLSRIRCNMAGRGVDQAGSDSLDDVVAKDATTKDAPGKAATSRTANAKAATAKAATAKTSTAKTSTAKPPATKVPQKALI